MWKLRVRCFSKNTGEVFYEYDTKTFCGLETAEQKLKFSRFVFKKLMSDLKEACTFEFTVLPCHEELPLDFSSDKFEDYNKTPVVF